ncbi:MAG: YdcH family protein [Paracoccaceae bacterium]
MTAEPRIGQLRRKHEDLEKRIAAEEKRPSADARTVATLKREKLQIKDEIARLSGAP